jgi:phosphoribosylanthranilate isomerase
VSEGPIIKVCGITNEADALLAVGLGATALGFNFAVSPRHVSVEAAGDIIRRLPDGVLTVGIFRDQPILDVIEAAADLGLGAVQLHGSESRDDSRFIADQVGYLIKVFVAGDPAVADYRAFGARHFLVDGPDPGSGVVFDWRFVEGVDDPSHMILSGGLRPGNVGEAIRRLRPLGVDVASGVEAEPGRKDAIKLRDFLAEARAAFAEVAPFDDRGSTGTATPYDWGGA